MTETTATTEAVRTVRCENCGKRNRVPAAANGVARCGHCKAYPPWIVDAGDEDFIEVAEEFEQTGSYYAATLMEAQLCAADPVVVVGGGNSAGQATVFLADHAGALQLVVRERRLDENMSRYLADRIEQVHEHLSTPGP